MTKFHTFFLSSPKWLSRNVCATFCSIAMICAFFFACAFTFHYYVRAQYTGRHLFTWWFSDGVITLLSSIIFFLCRYMRFCDALHWSPFWFLMRHFNVWLENVRSAAFHCNTCWKYTQRWERTNKQKIAFIKQVASGNFVRKQNVMDTLASISYQ